jgi:MFS family permease
MKFCLTFGLNKFVYRLNQFQQEFYFKNYTGFGIRRVTVQLLLGGNRQIKTFDERFFDITQSTNLLDWAMSSALTGCLFGTPFSGYFSDRFGRKLKKLKIKVSKKLKKSC